MELINISDSKFYIYTHGKTDLIGKTINKYKCWEPYITKIIYDILLNTSGAFVDIGANIGYYSLLIASLNRKVYAFEPSHLNYTLFKKSIIKNNLSKYIKLYTFGLGDTNKQIYLHYNSSNYGATKITNRKNR